MAIRSLMPHLILSSNCLDIFYDCDYAIELLSRNRSAVAQIPVLSLDRPYSVDQIDFPISRNPSLATSRRSRNTHVIPESVTVCLFAIISIFIVVLKFDCLFY